MLKLYHRKKTKKLHCIIPTGVARNLKFRLHSCFCVNSENKEYGYCTNKDYLKGHFTYRFVTNRVKEIIDNE